MSSVEKKIADWFLVTAEVLQRPVVELPLEELSELILTSFDGLMFSSTLRDEHGNIATRGFGWPSTAPTSSEAQDTIAELYRSLDLRLFDFHPLIRWYERSGETAPQSMMRVPRSMMSAWETREVCAVLRGLGVYNELSVPLLVKGKEHQAVVLSRPAGKDYTDEDLRLARWLQPMLSALQRQAELLASRPIPPELATLLSGRELAVLRCVTRGMTARAAGYELSVSPRTVEKHLEKVYRKLGVRDKVSAVLAAREFGLVEPGWRNRHARMSAFNHIDARLEENGYLIAVCPDPVGKHS